MNALSPRVQELLLHRTGLITEEDLKLLSEKERTELILELQRLSTLDFLTGLPNRRFFETDIRRLVERRARKGGVPFVIGMADVDHFKSVNDIHGHKVGDSVLHVVARCLSRGIRPEDRVCRWGGEEFALFLECVDNEKAFEIAERIRASVERSLFVAEKHGKEFKVTISIGLVDSSLIPLNMPPNKQIEELLFFADKALYVAKNGGRQCEVCRRTF